MSNGIEYYLFEEFKYRHELFWKIVFRFTYANLFLLAIPFLKVEYTQNIEKVVVFFPVTSILLTVSGVLLLFMEYKLLAFVESKYNDFKDELAKGSSNKGVFNHKNIGSIIIIVWGTFFIIIGIAESIYLLLAMFCNR